MTLRGPAPRRQLLQDGWEPWAELPSGYVVEMPWTPALPLLARPSVSSTGPDGPCFVYGPVTLHGLVEAARESVTTTLALLPYAHRLGAWEVGGPYSRAHNAVEALALLLHSAARLTLPGLRLLARDYYTLSAWWAAMVVSLPPRRGERA